MSIHAVVPLKPLAQGKRRLARVLSSSQRAELVRVMAHHVVEVLMGIDEIERVSVLTEDPALVPARCCHIHDPGPELNAAVAHAGRVIESLGGTSMLIVAADLPFLDSEDVHAMLAAGRRCKIVLASDAAGVGTNSLLVSPPASFVPSYGADSLALHLATARSLGASVAVVKRDGLACDIDEPADLESLTRARQRRLAG